MGHEVTVLAVDGDEVTRLDKAEDELQLFLGGVTVDVYGSDATVQHACAQAVQVVDGAVDQHLVTRDRGGREDDGVAGLDLDMAGGGGGPARPGGGGCG